jgi:hypothetical protein
MFKFTKQYPVFGRISNDQWEWLCRNIGAPYQAWTVSRGAVWFREQKHRTLYILRWA